MSAGSQSLFSDDDTNSEDYPCFTQESQNASELTTQQISDNLHEGLEDLCMEEAVEEQETKTPLPESEYEKTTEYRPEELKAEYGKMHVDPWLQHTDTDTITHMKHHWTEKCREFNALNKEGKNYCWALTMNRPSLNFEKALKIWVGNAATGSFLAVGNEYNTNDGHHIHVALRSASGITASAVKKLFPYVNIKKVEDGEKGFKRWILYCLKDKDPRNWCTNTDQLKHGRSKNKRKRDETCRDLATGVLSLKQLKNDDPAFFAYNIDKLVRIVPAISYKEREKKRLVYWLWGSGGKGKSFGAERIIDAILAAWKEAGENEECYVTSAAGMKWFDNYIGQRIVLMDDLRASSMTYSMLLNLLGNRDQRVEMKGASTNWTAEIVVITTSIAPWEMYKGMVAAGDDMDQLCRRIYVAYDCNIPGLLEGQPGFEYWMGEGNAQGGGIGPNGEAPHLRFPGSVWHHYMEVIKKPRVTICIYCHDREPYCVHCQMLRNILTNVI